MFRHRFPIAEWARRYNLSDLRPDLGAGITVAAMLVPQAMAYALLAGLPPEVGLYASTVPIVAYALFGSSRQLAVGPVAIVSLLTATALAPLVEQGGAGYLAAAALLAVMVGIVHLVLALARMGALVKLLSHAVLVGFTAAAAIVIGFSQVRHLLGVSIERQEHFHGTVAEVIGSLEDANRTTLAIGVIAFAALLAMKRFVPRLPGALVVVIMSIIAVELFDLTSRGVAVVGDIPDSLPRFALPELSGSLIGDLLVASLVITLVGFMESVAVAKVYARRNRYAIDPNQELVGLGAANVASGLFGGFPVTGGFSRTAVNASANARTPLASIITAALVLVSIAFLTPLLSSLPSAALAAIVLSAVVGLIDIAEMRHIAHVKPSDLISMATAFFATLLLGVEIGIGVAVIASILVVFGRMSTPHTAVLGLVDDTSTYRNVDRFPEVGTFDDVRILRIDAALSFVNSTTIKDRVLQETIDGGTTPSVVVLDASGINDVDATAADMLHDLLTEMDERSVCLHLAGVKGPVRDVLRRAGIWDRLDDRIHASTHDAINSVHGHSAAATSARRSGVDERDRPAGTTSPAIPLNPSIHKSLATVRTNQ